MITEVPQKIYKNYFSRNLNPYISDAFIGLVEGKVDRVIRLASSGNELSIGLTAGIRNNEIHSPFSAPFGGFHCAHEHLYYHNVASFLTQLKEYVAENGYQRIVITLPPDLYHRNMNAKFVNAFLRQGFTMSVPEIVNWVDLKKFDGTWATNRIAQNYKKAMRYNLVCINATDEESKRGAYQVVLNNRMLQDREIHMDFEDLMKVNEILPVDFFLVKTDTGKDVGAAVFYRGHPKIIQGIFMGDDLEYRQFGVMDLMVKHIYEFYKEMDYDFIDFGRSSIDGVPNIGLIRFKEIHNAVTSLGYTFSWSPQRKESSEVMLASISESPADF